MTVNGYKKNVTGKRHVRDGLQVCNLIASLNERKFSSHYELKYHASM